MISFKFPKLLHVLNDLHLSSKQYHWTISEMGCVEYSKVIDARKEYNSMKEASGT